MDSINLKYVTNYLLARQHLAPTTGPEDILNIVRDIGGLHATGASEPYLALFARMHKFAWKQLDTLLYIDKTLCKFRCMRGTLYIFSLDMLPAAYAATYPMIEKLSRRYAEYRGLSMTDYPELAAAIQDMLRHRQLSTNEIKKTLDQPSLHISSLLNLMCDRGLLVRLQGSRKSQSYRYALFTAFFPDINLQSMSETEGTKQLLRSYLHSFGPVTIEDMTWWTGLIKAKIHSAVKAMENEIIEVSVPELSGEFLVLRSEIAAMRKKTTAESPIINILPVLDPYLMGYKHRDRYLDYQFFNYIFDPVGNATSTILLDGKIIGIWDIAEKTNIIKFYLLDGDTSREVLKLIHTKAEAIGEFIAGNPVTIKRVFEMIPLTERTYGGFMSPLRNSE